MRDTDSNANFKWSSFKLVTEEDVRKMILSTKSMSYSQDPIPISLMKKCMDSLLPFITKIINVSLFEGVFPSDLKKA